MLLIREVFKKPLSIVKVSATNEASAVAIGGRNCSIEALTGNIYVNFNGTTAAATTGFLLEVGNRLNVNAVSLSFISDSTATAQVIIYAD